MLGTGKYNFPGIRAAGKKVIQVLISSTAWGAALVASPFMPLINLILDFVLEWLANRGLLVLNVAEYYVGGLLDTKRLSAALEEGIVKAQGSLTPEQVKEIDDAVIEAADKALAYGKLIDKP